MYKIGNSYLILCFVTIQSTRSRYTASLFDITRTVVRAAIQTPKSVQYTNIPIVAPKNEDARTRRHMLLDGSDHYASAEELHDVEDKSR